ncbi:hypothetical protein V1504DRAFT_54574 [Lipomyces starkeyi]
MGDIGWSGYFRLPVVRTIPSFPSSAFPVVRRHSRHPLFRLPQYDDMRLFYFHKSAWTDAVTFYNSNANGLSFPEAISNYFRGPEGMACGVTSHHNGRYCLQAREECDDTDKVTVPRVSLAVSNFRGMLINRHRVIYHYNSVFRVSADFR